MRMMRSAAPGSTSSYPSRMSGVGRGPEIRRSSCRTCLITRPDWSGGPLFGFAGGRGVFFGARGRFRLMTNPRGCVLDTLPYTTPVVSNSLLGRCSRDETFVAAWIRVDIHDTSRSAEHGAHSIGHRDTLDDDCMDSEPSVLPQPSRTVDGKRNLPRGEEDSIGGRPARSSCQGTGATAGAIAWRFRCAESRMLPAIAGAGASGQRGGRTGPPPRASMVPDTGSGALRPK